MSLRNVVCFILGCLLAAGCDAQSGVGTEDWEDKIWVSRLNRGLEERPAVSDAGAVTSPLADVIATPPTATNLHQLIEERYPETISLPDLVRKLGASPEGRQLLQKMLGVFQSVAGVEIPKEELENILAHPETVLDLLQFTPDQLAAARDIAYQIFAGIADLERPNLPLPGILKNEFLLPEFFDYDLADEITYDVPPGELIPVIDGVYFGVQRDPMYTQEELRQNFILAEVIERLGLNASATDEELFRVAYDGKIFTRLSEFLQALLNDGHEMRAMIRHYVAPFFPVYATGEDDGLHPVAAAAFLRTGIVDAEGVEAALPLFHSEFVFSIGSTERTSGRGVKGAVQFYQGIPKTGFYGEGNMDRPLWLGEVVSEDAFSSEQAAVAMLLAGYLVDVTRAVAKERQLPFDGWGMNGVCNDSTAIIQQAVQGKINSYPLFMPDGVMAEELTGRMEESFYNSGSYLDFLVYWHLRQAVYQTPEDVRPTADSLVRLLTSFPWEAGDEPFYSVVDARRIISQYGDTAAPRGDDSPR